MEDDIVELFDDYDDGIDDQSPKTPSNSPKRKRLKRREPTKQPNQINIQFEFQKDDDDDPYTITSDESYEGSAGDDIRQELGIRNESMALHDAFNVLQTGNWKDFLEQPVIAQKFKLVNTLIESCGFGKGVVDTYNLWYLYWGNRLLINKLDHAIRNQECISCKLDRHLIYVIYEIDFGQYNLLGYMGDQCFEIRFMALIELIRTCKHIASNIGFWPIESIEFEENVIEPLQLAMDKIIETPKNMANFKLWKNRQLYSLIKN
jgi:hypothetical protein